MTMVYSSDFFFFFFFFNADKAHVAHKLSLVNVAALNKVLWSEIFVSENGATTSRPLSIGLQALVKLIPRLGPCNKGKQP